MSGAEDSYSEEHDVSSDDELDAEESGGTIKVTDDSGVTKQILTKGKGWEKPKKGADVSVHYVGKLEDGSVFDSSRERDEPFTFKLGLGRVIEGWDKGVATMKKGEKALFTIQAQYGYKAAGSPPKIPPNATLIFEVELLSWTDFVDLSKDGGVIKRIVTEAEGWEKPKEDATVVINYRLTLEDGTPIEEKQHFSFLVGAEEVVSGLEKGVLDMKKGEVSRFTLQPKYAFGSSGAEKGIPDNTNVIYEVELVDFTKEKESWEMSTAEKFDACEKAKTEGNELFKAGKLERAAKKYEKALGYVDSDYSMEESEKEEAKPKKVACNLNIAMCSLKLRDYADVFEKCKKVLEIDDKNIKALFRRAQAYTAKDEWDTALQDLEKALHFEPNNNEVKREIALVKKKKAAQDAKDRKRFAGMFERLQSDEDASK